MDKKRKVYAPFSLTSEAGVAQTPVEGYIDVNQVIYPTVNTGTVNENGKWVGVKASDNEFIGLQKAEGIADAGEVFLPDSTNVPNIDMTGFSSLFIAIKPTVAGNFRIEASMGSDAEPFANLSPVNPLSPLRGLTINRNIDTFDDLLVDSAEALVANVWNIFYIQGSLQDQKNMRFKIINNTGSATDIEFGFMRLV